MGQHALVGIKKLCKCSAGVQHCGLPLGFCHKETPTQQMINNESVLAERDEESLRCPKADVKLRRVFRTFNLAIRFVVNPSRVTVVLGKIEEPGSFPFGENHIKLRGHLTFQGSDLLRATLQSAVCENRAKVHAHRICLLYTSPSPRDRG